MKEEVFYLHIAFLFTNEIGSHSSDTVYKFEKGDDSGEKAEPGENGRPKITPEILESIRAQLRKANNADKVIILSWQWFDGFFLVYDITKKAQTNLFGLFCFFLLLTTIFL